MQNTIEIFISVKDENDPSLTHLVKMFDGSSTSGRTVPSINIIEEQTYNPEFDPDYNLVLDCFSKTTNPNSYTLICKNTAVSVANSQTIFDVLEKAIDSYTENEQNYFDIFYLAKWMDRCDLYTNIRTAGDTGLKIVDTASPNGVLCIMFSPEGRQKFQKIFDPVSAPVLKSSHTNPKSLGHYLNSLISQDTKTNKDKFTAITTVPSLVNFNVTERKNDKELMKTIECREIPKNTADVKNKVNDTLLKSNSSNSNNTTMTFWWFLLIIVLILVVAWLLIVFTARKPMGAAPPSTLGINT